MTGKILYAERDELCVHLLTGCLEKAGWEVTSAASSEEALEKIRVEQPDVVITGAVLLASSGYELCRLIKRDEDPLIRKIPVIFLSWHDRSEDIGQGFRAGANSYLAKPFDLDELKAVTDAAS